jgi:hypothetical protein
LTEDESGNLNGHTRGKAIRVFLILLIAMLVLCWSMYALVFGS